MTEFMKRRNWETKRREYYIRHKERKNKSKHEWERVTLWVKERNKRAVTPLWLPVETVNGSLASP